MSKRIRIVPRRRKADNVPELFMVEDGELTCYAHVGQHSQASRGYFLDCTKLRVCPSASPVLLC